VVLTVDRVVAALGQLTPHASHLLRSFALATPSVDQLATLEGIGAPQAAIALLRASRELTQALDGQPRPPLTDAEEADQAPRFAQALTRRESTPEAELVLDLVALAPQLGPALERQRQADARSPRHRAETVLRWVAIVGIVALSAWFWWKDHDHPKFEARPGMPGPLAPK
jgi:hypothetical protein